MKIQDLPKHLVENLEIFFSVQDNSMVSRGKEETFRSWQEFQNVLQKLAAPPVVLKYI